jgi:predicted transcriptional regulator
MPVARIRLTGCQIKSLEIARALAKALDVLEKQSGIGSVYIEMNDCFICPDINLCG